MKEYEDNYLLDLILEGDEEAKNILFKKYEGMIKNTAKKYISSCNNLGLDINDLIQEAMLTFNTVIYSFNKEKDNIFYTYLKVCIENKLLSLLIKSNRPKYNVTTVPLVSENDETLDYILSDSTANPENFVLESEQANELYNKIFKSLTLIEQKVLTLKINGFSYKEIAECLGKDKKSIDNALRRIRAKAKKTLSL